MRSFWNQDWGGHNEKYKRYIFSNTVNPKCNPVNGGPSISFYMIERSQTLLSIAQKNSTLHAGKIEEKLITHVLEGVDWAGGVKIT